MNSRSPGEITHASTLGESTGTGFFQPPLLPQRSGGEADGAGGMCGELRMHSGDGSAILPR